MSIPNLEQWGLEGALTVAREAAAMRTPEPSTQDLVAWIAFARLLLGGTLPPWTDEALPTDTQTLDDATAALSERWSVTDVALGELAAALEGYLARSDRGKRDGRRRRGAYYTPPELIDLVVERTLVPVLDLAATVDEVLSLRIIDPAVGTGGFLVAAAHRMADRMVEVATAPLSHGDALTLAVSHCLFGVDADPLAALLTTAELAALARDPAGMGNVQWADTLLPADTGVSAGSAPPLDGERWAHEVPDGFDIAIGNPPWGALKPAVRTYLAAAEPSLLGAQGADLRDRLRRTGAVEASWEVHASEVRSYAKALRASGEYAYQGRGDADLYRYFIERVHQFLRPDGGRFGLLVPAAFLRSDGCTPLRNLLFDNGTFEGIAELVNAERVFDIHAMFRFVLLVWQQGEPRGIARAQFAARSVEDVRDAHRLPSVAIPLPFLDHVSGGRRTVPDVRSDEQATLLKRLYDEYPTLEEPGCEWTCRYVRELDMTNDSHLFSQAQGGPENQVPVYEGRMVHQFDARAKRYEGGAGRRAVWTAQGLGARDVVPHYVVPASVADAYGPGVDRAGFCDITGHANERTVLAALLPAHAVAGNKVPTLRFDRDDPELHLVWLAVANSFVIDWIARRRVSTSLNFFQLGQLPFPRIEPSTPLGGSVVRLARELCQSDDWWDIDLLEMRAMQRAELDSLVAEVFDLDLPALALLLGDFPLLDRHQPGATPARRSTVTRDLVLSTYAARTGHREMTLTELGIDPGHGSNDLVERLQTARALGQIAYVPGEVARSLQLAHPAI